MSILYGKNNNKFLFKKVIFDYMSEDKIKYNDQITSFNHNIGEIIRALMAERKIDDTRLATATGIATSSLSRIKNDPNSNPTLASLLPIANFFDITISQLIGERGLSKGYVTEPARNKTMIVKQVPVIAWQEIKSFKSNKLQEFSHWIPSNQLLSKEAFALIVKSSNWRETFYQGAYLIIDPAVESSDGDYALIYSKEEDKYFPKKVLLEGIDIYLQSLNPDLKLTEKIKPSESVFAKILEVRLCFNK